MHICVHECTGDRPLCIKKKNSTISEGGVPLTPAYENTVLNNEISDSDKNVNSNSENSGKKTDFSLSNTRELSPCV